MCFPRALQHPGEVVQGGGRPKWFVGVLPGQVELFGEGKGVFDQGDLRELALDENDFHDIETEGGSGGVEETEPFEGALSDELLFLAVNGVQGPTEGGRRAGFDFNEEERFVLAANDIHFASLRSAEIAVEDLGVRLA